MKKVVVVTRHPALVDFLIESGVITEADRAGVIAHATAEDITGKHVVGVLPHGLSSLCETYTEVSLMLPAELRGVELNLDQVREHATEIVTYKVTRVS